MIRNTFTFLSLLIFMQSAIADVPFIFAPGTPARAAEVNSNFESLGSEIESIKSQLECEFDALAHKFDQSSYSEITSFSGQVINITGSNPITIIEVPFVEFGTGDIYRIRFPSSLGAGGSLTTVHVATPEACYSSAEISGFNALVNVFETRGISPGSSSSSYGVGMSINILVGETQLNIQVSGVSIEEQSAPFDSSNFDGTDDIDTLLMNHRQDVINGFLSLVNYINITKAN